MNNRMILRVSVMLCTAALVGCAAATPGTVAPVAATNQPMPVMGNTSTAAAMPAAPAGSAALACSDGSTSASLTPELAEGPFFKPNSPERASLIGADTLGTKLVITGKVYSMDCKPVAHALLEFWQANASGVYDNSGYALRGHQYTDANGHYELITIVPGLYTGRTEHIHVKVQAPNGQLITTQLFFPDVAQNDADGIFNPVLVMIVQQPGSDGEHALYNFVVPTP